MKPPLLVCAGLALLLGGCASSPSETSRRQPYVRPGLIMLTADQAERRGLKLQGAAVDHSASPSSDPLDESAVVAGVGVKVYSVNRAVDPADPDVMHEEHVVYRREASPQWRLQAPADRKLLVGPRVTDGRQELQPLLEKELTTYLADQRRATEANEKAIQALFQAVDALNRQQQQLATRDLNRSGSPATAEHDPASEPASTPAAGAPR